MSNDMESQRSVFLGKPSILALRSPSCWPVLIRRFFRYDGFFSNCKCFCDHSLTDSIAALPPTTPRRLHSFSITSFAFHESLSLRCTTAAQHRRGLITSRFVFTELNLHRFRYSKQKISAQKIFQLFVHHLQYFSATISVVSHVPSRQGRLYCRNNGWCKQEIQIRPRC